MCKGSVIGNKSSCNADPVRPIDRGYKLLNLARILGFNVRFKGL